jgi:hypothetical protein
MKRPRPEPEVGLARPGDAYAAIRVPEYGDLETITVGEIAVGDFVVEIPKQSNVRGIAPRSAVVRIEARYNSWTAPSAPRPRAKRIPVESRRIVFVSYSEDGRVFDYPTDFDAVVRRPRREG